MKKIITEIKSFLKEIGDSHISAYTSSCAYFIILAFIPFLLLILTLTKYIGLDKLIIASTIEESLPDNILNNTITGIIKEVYSKSIGTITISAVFVLWSAGKGFFAFCQGLDAAYGIKKKNKYIYFRIKGIICTIIFIIAIILSLIILVFGNKINLILQTKFNIYNKIINILIKCRILISILILTVLFTFIYKYIPKHKMKFKYQIPGAIFSAIACNLISIFYAIYVNVYTGFSMMYGSLTTAVLAMMWIYACMYSILVGAIINKKVGKRFEQLVEKDIKVNIQI